MAPKRKPAAGKSGAKASKKRKEPSSSEDEIDDVEDEKPAKAANKKSKNNDDKPQTIASMSSLHSINFDVTAKSPSGKPWNFKIASWNVNGLRSWLQKDGLEYVKRENPDIFCVMETKSSKEKIPPSASSSDYTNYWLSGDTEGYSGVGIYTKIKPLHVSYGIGMDEHDKEGRIITAEYEKFYLVAAYVPNSGRKLVRHEYRQKWDVDFRNYLKNLEKKKPVILCGDLNVAHQEIDLANPKTNKKTAGFTKEERDAFTELLDSGFIDSFRQLHPDEKGAYTFWTYMMNARAKNVGWRLDYFTFSKSLLPNLCESIIRKDVLGSDHCPIVLFMAF